MMLSQLRRRSIFQLSWLIKDGMNELFNGLCHADTLRNYELLDTFDLIIQYMHV